MFVLSSPTHVIASIYRMLVHVGPEHVDPEQEGMIGDCVEYVGMGGEKLGSCRTF